MDKLEEIKYKINSIKSQYILKLVYSFLNEKQKLNMIIYNKELQKKLDVDIEEYKKVSGKYKVGEKNGKGKEYELNTNKLIFEGEYINGKRNGKGKEYYYNGNLKFEGEYLNGKIWNWKGYDKVGDIEFEIKEGKGKVKEYDYEGKLLFEGEYINGKRNGIGKEYKHPIKISMI